MAAPASTRCSKCGYEIPTGTTTCPECGAPVDSTSLSEAESTVYPQLAKANLARMRGDYKQAEDELLSVLRLYPNNPSANEMLGDLAGERDDYTHAIQWYELALEIVPDSASIARKLREARGHLAQRETKDTTAQLGLADPSSRMPIVVGALIVVIVGVAIGAYVLGTKTPVKTGSAQVNVIRAEPPEVTTPTNDHPNVAPSATPALVREDDELFQAIKAKATDASALIAASHDPRSGTVTITFTMPTSDHRSLAARLAKDAFSAAPDYPSVTLRGVLEGKVVYEADATRERVAETDTQAWRDQHAEDANAWVSYVLQNEWPAASASPPGGQSTGTATPNDASGASGTGTQTTGQ